MWDENGINYRYWRKYGATDDDDWGLFPQRFSRVLAQDELFLLFRLHKLRLKNKSANDICGLLFVLIERALHNAKRFQINFDFDNISTSGEQEK